jgi:uncharacterized YigZ family protein
MTDKRYLIPAKTCRTEIEVKRSRFIATLEMTPTPQAALDFIARIKQEFPDANHNCWAYLIGPPGNTDRIGLSDDGEPHGVAGKPLLTTLQHSHIGDISVVVTRYFGGTKLGKGGMVKAYTLAVQTALELLEKIEKIDWEYWSVSVTYPLLNALEQVLPNYEARSIETRFGEQIEIDLKVPQEKSQELQTRLVDLTAGQIQIKKHQPED